MIKVAYSNCKRIFCLTEEQKMQIRKDLTFKNPAYESVLKYSKYAKTKVPPYLHYYKDNKAFIEVPMGYVLKIDDFEVVNDSRVVNTVGFPKFVLELRDIQKQATEAWLNSNYPYGTLVLRTGEGKAQPLDTKILTPNGYILMGDIKVGDEVIGEDGNFYKVSGVFPQGEKDVYELTFKDGSKTRCCKEHLWKYMTHNMAHTNRSKFKVGELQDILNNGLKHNRSYNFLIPINNPINYPEQEVLIPPYVLGLLLGDGCLSMIDKKGYNVYFSNTEQDLIDSLNEGMGDLGHFYLNKSTQCCYIFKNNEGKKDSRFFNEIRRLGLNVLGENKFIPDVYKYNSIENRMELLKGLFDTDGCVAKNGSYKYTSTSYSLIKDLEFLCRSLGYRTTFKAKDRRCQTHTVNGKEYVRKNIEYELVILTSDKIFKSEKHNQRKIKADSKHREAQRHKYDLLAVTDVKYVGKKECQCIMVDSDDHTYLCDDFIVTHNTVCGLYLASAIMERTLIVVNKDDLIEGWKKDIELAFNGEADVGLVKGKEFNIGKHFTLCTIQTLVRLGENKLKQLYENIGFIVIDEVHHAAAKTYQVLFNFPAKFRLGLTATKMRNDGLVEVVDLICGGAVFDGSKLKSDAIIAPENILIKVRKSNVKWYYKKSYYDAKTLKDIHSFVYKGNQYVEGTPEWRDICSEFEALGKIKAYPLRLHEAYAKIANDDNFNRMICADIKRNYNEGKSCIVFCKTIEQLDNLYEMLLPSCPKIQKFYGNMGDSKEEVLKKAESKEVLVTLATVAIATEGTNVKSWEVGFLVSSVANEKDLIQIIGRLRRTKEGKEKIIFYDYRHPFVSGICYHGYKRDIFYKNMGIFNTEVE